MNLTCASGTTQAHHVQDLGVPFDARKEAPHIEPHEMVAHFFASKPHDEYGSTLWSYTTKEAHLTPLLQRAASYLPFPDLTHHVLQIDILIEGALPQDWEEIVKCHCFSGRTGYRCTSPTQENDTVGLHDVQM